MTFAPAFGEAVDGYVNGWDDERGDDIYTEAKHVAAERVGDYVGLEQGGIVPDDVFDDMVQDNATTAVRQVREAYSSNGGISDYLKQDKLLEEAQERYLQDHAPDEWEDISVSAKADDEGRYVRVRVPDACDPETVAELGEYGGEVDVTFSVRTGVEPGSLEEMRDQVDHEEGEITKVRPDIEFDGGRIGYHVRDDSLDVEIWEYTEEAQDVLETLTA